MDRTFTQAEAEALLPVLRPLLEELRRLREEGARLDAELRELHWKARGNGHDALDGSLSGVQRRREEILNQIGERVDRLHAMGVHVKDPDTGLVDFPTPRGQRIVYLCWRLGEERISWWHEIEAGFAGRQPLE